MRGNRMVVYTAIYGNHDGLKEPSVSLDDCSLVCFTDSGDLESDVFEVRKYPGISFDPTRCARFFKLLPHLFFPDYEYSMWIDASIIIKKGNLRDLVERYLRDDDIAMYAHPERNCIYEEGAICIAQGKDLPQIINDQLDSYRRNGYPERNGLVETGVILRRHLAPAMIRFDTEWWNEVVKYSRRDQLSFNYIASKNHLHWATIEGNLRDGEYFKLTHHTHSTALDQSIPEKDYVAKVDLLHDKIQLFENDLIQRENQIDMLTGQVDALDKSLSLKIGRKIPFGKGIRRLFVRRDKNHRNVIRK